jgi:carbamoyl-phosphate synthase small subunit
MLGRIVQGSGQDSVVSGQKISMKDPNEINLVTEVSCYKLETYKPKPEHDKNLTILAYDCGMKRNILRSLLKRGLTVVRVPWDFDPASYTGKIDGLFCSNGPGDPKQCGPTISAMKYGVEKNIPTFGICLGNQLLALAIGGDTYKLPYGHRGVNQPCVEWKDGKMTDRCIITSQNHGFAVSEKLPKDWNVWFTNANDNTVEGIRHTSGRFFSVQFHPEATPGPEDANYLFDEFVTVMEESKK